jgi:hypothetical protein
MALGTLTVQAGYTVDNTQKRIILQCQLKFSAAGDTYPANGITLDSVLLSVPEVTTNSGVKWAQIQSDTGSGYIYTRIPSTGKMQILQIPPNGSLTTAAPLQQIPSSTNMQGVFNDVITCRAEFLRNA